MHSFSSLHLGDGLLCSPTIPGRGVYFWDLTCNHIAFVCILSLFLKENSNWWSALRCFRARFLIDTNQGLWNSLEWLSLTSQENLGGSTRFFLSAKPEADHLVAIVTSSVSHSFSQEAADLRSWCVGNLNRKTPYLLPFLGLWLSSPSLILQNTPLIPYRDVSMSQTHDLYFQVLKSFKHPWWLHKLIHYIFASSLHSI